MASASVKAPPAFNKGDDYTKWKKKLGIWQKLTTLEVAKQGPAVLFVLSEEAQDAALELEEASIACATGVKNITECLDKLYIKDKTQTAFDALEAFETRGLMINLSLITVMNLRKGITNSNLIDSLISPIHSRAHLAPPP